MGLEADICISAALILCNNKFFANHFLNIWILKAWNDC